MRLKRNEHHESAAPAPSPETNTLMVQMIKAMLSNSEVAPYLRDMFQQALHDLKGKVQLYQAMELMQRMEEQSFLRAGARYGKERMADPEYIARLRTDPEIFRKHVEALHKMGEDNSKKIDEMLEAMEASKKSPTEPFNPQQQFNFIFAENSGGTIGLPEQMQDRVARKKFLERANQAFALLEGSIPDAPPNRKRLRQDADERVIDIENAPETPLPPVRGETPPEDEQDFWDKFKDFSE